MFLQIYFEVEIFQHLTYAGCDKICDVDGLLEMTDIEHRFHGCLFEFCDQPKKSMNSFLKTGLVTLLYVCVNHSSELLTMVNIYTMLEEHI